MKVRGILTGGGGFEVANPNLWCFGLSVLLGVLVGASEVLARYRDEPWLAVVTRPGLSYLALNGVISGCAYLLVRHYKDRIFPGLANDLLLTSFLAGFGAMLVMRSKVLSFKTEGGEEYAVGPDAVISAFLKSVDRKIDRNRSAGRQQLVIREMAAIADAKKAAAFLTTSLASYQNLSLEEKNALAEEIKRLQSTDLPPQLILMAMGFGFLNITGEANFSLLIEQLAAYMSQGGTQPDVLDEPPHQA